LEHLIWYLNAKPRPKGELEAKLGDSCSPMKLCPGSRKVEAAGAEKLDTLIAYVQAEVDEKDLRARASMVQHRIIALEDVCLGHGKSGQAALDDYVEELVAALRDFPYHRLRGGKEVGTWVRDEVVAPVFKGHWDFYSNRKRVGFSLDGLVEALCSEKESSLLHRLQYAKLAGGL